MKMKEKVGNIIRKYHNIEDAEIRLYKGRSEKMVKK